MKKLERNIPGVYDFDEVLDYLHRGIMDMRTNVVWNLIQMQDTVTLAGRDGRLFLSVVPGASHQYADIAGVDETMDWIRTLADQLTG